ncbi:hypothetical protein [Cupriavidus metallidurans]|uniref:Outer membrane protein beta-barrel domain-containing protein n=1 Tax=Cupriavidus metallidurans (strain ATCC 43123 / DSM 2839 / NBRC 102507 / CH34) TaxID=266264 RepID=Q1LPE6_CUPMC|nr:hypothetical protein [Cupriavidus metallidurans]ABF07980.1 hypothetical protein; putative exported protein [Cupriavidus metallidurans CH34]
MGRSVLRGVLPRYLVFLAFAASAFAAHAWTAGSDGGAGAATASPDTESGPYRGIVGPVGTAEPAPEAPKEWDRALPFFAQRVIDKGYNLPNPYNIGYSYYNGYQRYQLSDLAVSAGSNPLRAADFVQFQQSKLHNVSNQFQLGAWIFPFLNVYGMIGTIEGNGAIDISFSSKTDLQQFFGINIGCGGSRPRPECSNPIKLPTQFANYSGHTFGGGFTLVGTYKQLFFSLPVTYTVSDITMSETPVQSINIGPRIGWNFRLGPGLGLLTPFVGVTYFRTHAKITGHFDVPIQDAGGQTARLNYEINQSVVGAWSGSAGVSWAVNRSLGFIMEFGYGYNRNNIIATGFFRF